MITVSMSNTPGVYGTVSVDIDLPALDGSDKQVEWAVSLRDKAIRQLLAEIVGSPRMVKMIPALTARGYFAALRAEVEARTDARVWIDSRSDAKALKVAVSARLAAQGTSL